MQIIFQFPFLVRINQYQVFLIYCLVYRLLNTCRIRHAMRIHSFIRCCCDEYGKMLALEMHLPDGCYELCTRLQNI